MLDSTAKTPEELRNLLPVIGQSKSAIAKMIRESMYNDENAWQKIKHLEENHRAITKTVKDGLVCLGEMKNPEVLSILAEATEAELIGELHPAIGISAFGFFKELPRDTKIAIFNQALVCLPEEELGNLLCVLLTKLLHVLGKYSIQTDKQVYRGLARMFREVFRVSS